MLIEAQPSTGDRVDDHLAARKHAAGNQDKLVV
jgi:hypothetical protein